MGNRQNLQGLVDRPPDLGLKHTYFSTLQSARSSLVEIAPIDHSEVVRYWVALLKRRIQAIMLIRLRIIAETYSHEIPVPITCTLDVLKSSTDVASEDLLYLIVAKVLRLQVPSSQCLQRGLKDRYHVLKGILDISSCNPRSECSAAILHFIQHAPNDTELLLDMYWEDVSSAVGAPSC